MLKKTSLFMWYNAFIKRFKERTSAALINIQFFRYTFDDVRKQKNSRIFAQRFFRHVKTINITSIHNQMTMIWNNLNWQFRRDISKSIESISVRHFLDQLDNHANIWFEMTKNIKLRFDFNREYSKSFTIKSYQFWNKSTTDNFVHFNRNNASFFRKFIYQDRSQNKSNDIAKKKRSFRVEITTKVKVESKDQDYDKFWEKRKYDSREKTDRWKNKSKAYMMQEQDIENSDDFENYHHSKDLKYFKSDENDDDEASRSKKTFANISMTAEIACRICKKSFVFNNALHKHFRENNCFQLFYLAKSFKTKIDATKIDATNDVFTKSFTAIVSSLAIVSFKINFNQDIDTHYDFKDWQYVITQLSFVENASIISKCVDSEAEITLANAVFFKV